jgi:hypothetical protein
VDVSTGQELRAFFRNRGPPVTDLDQKTSKMTGARYGSRDDNLELINYDADL